MMQFNLQNRKKLIVVYQLVVMRQVIFVGSTPFTDLPRLSDAFDNSEFKTRMRAMPTEPIGLTILATYEDEKEAKEAAQAWITMLSPHCNVHGKSLASTVKSGGWTAIECSDGERFASITAAAKHYNIPRATIHAHLAGKEGYHSPHGLFFRKVSQ